MTKAVTLFQTFFLFLLPFAQDGINFSLSFPGSGAGNDANAPAISRQDPPAAAFAPGHRMGKVIKESIIEKTEYRIKTVVIDAGHGGHDPGCLGSNSQEKHLALAMAKKLAEGIQRRFPEVKVILTRDKDVFIPLHERAAIANRNEADLFISIHCNFMPGSRATQGSETYVMGLHTAEHNLEVAKRENASILLEEDYRSNYDYDPNSPEGHIMLSMFQNAYLEQSILFAEKVEQKFASYAQRKSRGVKQAGFVVLRETAMPSVLVEAGFLSNREEETFLSDENGQYAIAGAILSAFEEYKLEVDGGVLAAGSASGAPPPAAAATPSYFPPSDAGTNGRGLPAPSGSSPQNPSANTPVTLRQAPVEAPQPAAISPGPSAGATPPPPPVEERAGIQFHVQLSANSKPLDTSGPRWRNTGYLIELVREDNLYKYQARNFSSLQQAFEARLLLQARGFPDAFIVAYKNGRRISMEQAKQELGIP